MPFAYQIDQSKYFWCILFLQTFAQSGKYSLLQQVLTVAKKYVMYRFEFDSKKVTSNYDLHLHFTKREKEAAQCFPLFSFAPHSLCFVGSVSIQPSNFLCQSKEWQLFIEQCEDILLQQYYNIWVILKMDSFWWKCFFLVQPTW